MRRAYAAALLVLPPTLTAAQDAGAGASSRERAALAEEQALLQRQLARLRQSMELLAGRFEAEGRAHAAKLLRDGLAHISERVAEQDTKTLDELMSGAQTNLEAGQADIFGATAAPTEAHVYETVAEWSEEQRLDGEKLLT